MKRLHNTLYVMTPGSRLNREGGCVQVTAPERKPLKIPIATLDGIVCHSQITQSPAFLDHCSESGVTLTYLNEYGRFIGRLEGPISGNILLRREQYRRMDDPEAAVELARYILSAKLANSRVVLQRAQREKKADSPPLHDAIAGIRQALNRLSKVADLERLRGIEGEAAALYWGAFDALIQSTEPEMRFSVRSRRPPLDRVNALLSYVYTLLTHDIRSALEGVGLDPQAGFLHQMRPGRPSLALDILEEFRAPFADRLVLTLINRRQLTAKDFIQEPNGATRLKDDARRDLLAAYQERKREAVTHTFLKEKMPIGLIWHAQAQLLARHLRGDLDGYPAYIWK